jgi:hypothetical protein
LLYVQNFNKKDSLPTPYVVPGLTPKKYPTALNIFKVRFTFSTDKTRKRFFIKELSKDNIDRKNLMV